MRIAKQITSKCDVSVTDPIVKKLLKDRIGRWFSDESDQLDSNEMDEWQKRMTKWYARQYEAWATYLNAPLKKTIVLIMEQLIKDNT